MNIFQIKKPQIIIMIFFLFCFHNLSYANKKFSKTGKPQDEAFCKIMAPELRGINNVCLPEKNKFLGYQYKVSLKFYVDEDYKNILNQYKSENYIDELEKSKACGVKGGNKNVSNHNCAESKKIQAKNVEILGGKCNLNNSKVLSQSLIDLKIPGFIKGDFVIKKNIGIDYIRGEPNPNNKDEKLQCQINLTFNDKDAMCSTLVNKLLGHVTKEGNKITVEYIIPEYKQSVGEEVRNYPMGPDIYSGLSRSLKKYIYSLDDSDPEESISSEPEDKIRSCKNLMNDYIANHERR
jgi:hypothetical protein